MFSLQQRRVVVKPGETVKTLIGPELARAKPYSKSYVYQHNILKLQPNVHVFRLRQSTRTNAAVDWNYLFSYSRRRVQNYVKEHRLKEKASNYFFNCLYWFEVTLVQVSDSLRRLFLHIESEYHVVSKILFISRRFEEFWRDVSQKFNLRKRLHYLMIYLLENAPQTIDKISIFYQSFYGRIVTVIAFILAIRSRMFSKLLGLWSRIWLLVFLTSVLMAKLETLKRWHENTTAGPRSPIGRRGNNRAPKGSTIYDSEERTHLPHETLVSSIMDFLVRARRGSDDNGASRTSGSSQHSQGVGGKDAEGQRMTGQGASSFDSGPVIFAEWKPMDEPKV